mmetsp:Transcript_29827/g.59059  ORF Transcript_29827/g.59059 Transcript_29827/m.59059 type:complete len:285 (-) Transcript_29827:61-915(-)
MNPLPRRAPDGAESLSPSSRSTTTTTPHPSTTSSTPWTPSGRGRAWTTTTRTRTCPWRGDSSSRAPTTPRTTSSTPTSRWPCGRPCIPRGWSSAQPRAPPFPSTAGPNNPSATAASSSSSTAPTSRRPSTPNATSTTLSRTTTPSCPGGQRFLLRLHHGRGVRLRGRRRRRVRRVQAQPLQLEGGHGHARPHGRMGPAPQLQAGGGGLLRDTAEPEIQQQAADERNLPGTVRFRERDRQKLHVHTKVRDQSRVDGGGVHREWGRVHCGQGHRAHTALLPGDHQH